MDFQKYVFTVWTTVCAVGGHDSTRCGNTRGLRNADVKFSPGTAPGGGGLCQKVLSGHVSTLSCRLREGGGEGIRSELPGPSLGDTCNTQKLCWLCVSAQQWELIEGWAARAGRR